jgi:hypothetical protein
MLAGFVTPASAQDQIISTFDGVYAAEDKLAGYTTSVSVLPGEALKLRVRSAGSWSVKIVRIGSYAGGDGRVVDSVGVRHRCRNRIAPQLLTHLWFPVRGMTRCLLQQVLGQQGCMWPEWNLPMVMRLHHL